MCYRGWKTFLRIFGGEHFGAPFAFGSYYIGRSRHQPKGRAPEREARSPIALSARLGIGSGAAMLDMNRKRRGQT